MYYITIIISQKLSRLIEEKNPNLQLLVEDILMYPFAYPYNSGVAKEIQRMNREHVVLLHEKIADVCPNGTECKACSMPNHTVAMHPFGYCVDPDCSVEYPHLTKDHHREETPPMMPIRVIETIGIFRTQEDIDRAAAEREAHEKEIQAAIAQERDNWIEKLQKYAPTSREQFGFR